MLLIDRDNAIHLTRGDTARFQIDRAKNLASNEDYIFAPEDTVRLTIKKTENSDTILVQKVISGGQLFHIEPQDTKELKFGSYTYDVELTTAMGDVYTVVGPAEFEITKEVT